MTNILNNAESSKYAKALKDLANKIWKEINQKEARVVSTKESYFLAAEILAAHIIKNTEK